MSRSDRAPARLSSTYRHILQTAYLDLYGAWIYNLPKFRTYLIRRS